MNFAYVFAFLFAIGCFELSECKKKEKSMYKNTTEACLFVDCSCQNVSDPKLAINCTGVIGVRGGISLYFPKRIDNENFMDFNNQIDTFIFAQNNFKTINEDTFKNLRINCLEFRENRIEVLKQNTFRGIKQINRLLLINEKKLKTIQKDTFLPVKYLLLELDLSFNDINDTEFDRFSTEITKLSSLQQLNLNNNKLTAIKSKWFSNLTNLDILNLGYNNLKQIDPNGFTELRNLQRILLNNNQFSGHFDQAAFESLRPTLVRVTLANNKIKSLPVFGYLEKLRYLDLSNNSIELVETNTFTLLVNLYSLDLNNNFLSKIEKNAFASLSNLFYLKLKNNYLSKLPDISKMTSLVVLDLANQNGNLVTVNDYQFERVSMPNLALEVNLNQNDIINFKSKAFCSRNYEDSQLDSIGLSFKTFSSLIDSNHCVLTQLKPIHSISNGNVSSFNRHVWTQVSIADDFHRELEGKENYCNCDLMLMFHYLKLNVTGLNRCGLTGALTNSSALASKCANSTFIDTCSSQFDFQCNPLTTTTRPTRAFNSSRHLNKPINKSTYSTKPLSSVVYFVCFLFFILFKFN